MTGRIFSINISAHKGVSKDMVKMGILEEGYGFQGDAHAGSPDRQVSLLAVEDIEKIEAAHSASEVDFRPGIFAENITTTGIDLSKLKVGDRLIIAETAILRVTQVGKDCPKPCDIGRRIGQCLMPRHGVFASVEKGATIKVFDSIRLQRSEKQRKRLFLLWSRT